MKKLNLFSVISAIVLAAVFFFSCTKTTIEQETIPQLNQARFKSAVTYNCESVCLNDYLTQSLQELTLYYNAKPKYGVTLSVSQVISTDPLNPGISLRYTFTSTDISINDIHRIDIDGRNYFTSKNNAPAAPAGFFVDIPLGSWIGCDIRTAKVEVRRVDSDGTGPGQYLLFNTSVKLIPICTDTFIDVDLPIPVCKGLLVTVTGTVTVRGDFPLTGGEIQLWTESGEKVASRTAGPGVNNVTYQYRATSDQKFYAIFVPIANGFKGSISETKEVTTQDCTGFDQTGICENITESFTYSNSGDVYTIVYTPAQTIANAQLKFTLPGSDTEYSEHPGWSHSGASDSSATLWSCQDLECGVPITIVLTLVHKEHGNAPMFKAQMLKIMGTCK